MSAHGDHIDFEAEGLLDGLEGDARESRLALLEALAAEGVEAEELREAVAAGRLTLLPVERALSGSGPRYTPQEVADKAGVDLRLLQRATAALGVPYPDPDSRTLTDADLEAAQRVRVFLKSGLPEEGILQVARTIGIATARIAEANRQLIVRTLMQPGDTERDLGFRFADAARALIPVIGPTLIYALQAHLLEQIRRDVIDAADLSSGEITGTTNVTVCFADLVNFTRLSEERDVEEVGLVADRLEEMAIAVAEPPVRLVKLIGDAAMFVSTEPAAMVESALRLVEAAEAETGSFPRMRAGIALGPALIQAGDYYGRPVNMASRITNVALPGSVLASEEVRDRAPDGFRYSFAGERRLKGFEGRFKLYRVRRPKPPRK